MILLIGFAFIAGIITILSPCILPILPIVLSGSIGSGKRKPLGIIAGFILSFTFFTLFLAAIVKVTGLPPDALRSISIVIILLFGLSLLLPQFQIVMEKLFSKLSSKVAVSGAGRNGFTGGVLIGLSLGLVWTPCVGPIIASVITLAATSDVSLAAFFITLAYSVGTAIPMLAIMYGGRGLLQKAPWLLPNSGKIQKVFGLLMILTAFGIFFNVDRKFQSYILDTFPQYGAGLTSLEDNDAVRNQLDKLDKKNGSEVLRNNSKAPELIAGGKWFNLPPGEQSINISELKGKVVLVDFWTYTCINCIRTLPYLASWHEKYADDGLVIIGVHTPEFAFERDARNVEKAIEDFNIKYSVMQDNEYATWEAYSNRYWPAKYLIDANGIVQYTHFGEGKYEETERKIQELLKQAGSEVNEKVDRESDQSQNTIISSETYLGSHRMLFHYPEAKVSSGMQTFVQQKSLPTNKFSFFGMWTITDEYAKSGTNAGITYNFSGKNVYMVMRHSDSNKGTVKVYLDGKIIDSNSAGRDVTNGTVNVDKDRLYELISLPSSGVHELRLEFETPGTEAFTFTFG
jgi:cytochrome c biogenesis protein CcdA/thiol-disulfide isomerase/thioredoxin